MTTGKTIALTRWTFVGKVMSLLFIMLFRFVIAFLPRSKKQVYFLRVKHRRKTLPTECFVLIPLSSHLSTGTQSEHVPGRCAVGAVYCLHALGPFWMGLDGSVSISQGFSGGHPF